MVVVVVELAIPRSSACQEVYYFISHVSSFLLGLSMSVSLREKAILALCEKRKTENEEKSLFHYRKEAKLIFNIWTTFLELSLMEA